MKKRLLASLLSLCLMLSLLPTVAWATGGEDGGTQETEPTYLNETIVTRAILADLIYQNDHFKTVIGHNTADAGFADIAGLPETQKSAINALANAKYISGTGVDDGGKLLFNPSSNVSRAEVAVIFWKLTGSKKVDTSELTLTDVNATDWYAPAVAAMAAAEIISGTQNNEFQPTGEITVVQLNALINKCASDTSLQNRPAAGTRLGLLMEAYEKYKDSPLATVTANEIDYADIGVCTTDEQTAIQFFTSRGVVSGYRPDGSGVNLFGPYDAASNLQAAVFLYQCAIKFDPESVSPPESAEASSTMLAQTGQATLFAQSVFYDLIIPDYVKNTINAAWTYLEQEVGAEKISSFKNRPNDALSPNAVSSLVNALVPVTPTISVSEGQVTISTTDSDSLLYYTTDGVEPTVESTQYTVPFELAAEITTIKAVAVKNSLYSEVATHTIQGADPTPEPANLTITASPASLTGGGTVTLSTSRDVSRVVCADSNISVTGSGTTWSAILPNATATYVFTAEDGEDNAACSVSVTRRSSSGGSSSSGSSSTTTTETTRNPDGSTTTTTTNKRTGETTETTKTTDGVTGTVVTNKNGDVTSISAKVPSSAANNNTVVTLPVELPAAKDSEEAPSVEINVPSRGATVEIPVEDVSSGLVAVLVNEDGTEEIIRSSAVSGDGVIVDLDSDATIKIVDYSVDFADVAPGSTFEDAIDFMSARGLMNGVGDGSNFGGNGTATRAMVWTILGRGMDEDLYGVGVFDRAGAWAMENGISDGSNPNGNITRQQFAVMLWRMAGEPFSVYDISHFNDDHHASDYAEMALRWAVELGILTGNGGNLNPGGNATRNHIAAMYMRYANAMNQ